MTLFQLTLKNLARRRMRTTLTILGIGLGIGAVVALLGMAWGLSNSWKDAYKARKTDLVLRRAGSGIMAQPFEEKILTTVRQSSGVEGAAGLLTEVVSVEDVPMLVLSGREWGSYLWENLEIISGRLPSGPDEKAVVLGKLAAEMLQKKPGDTVTLETDDFLVAGIVDGRAVVENGSVLLSLGRLQELMSKQGQINFINVRLSAKAKGDIRNIAEKLEQAVPACRVDIADDVVANNDGVKTFEAMNWGTSVIAILVGSFGVMNTMFMSVFERSHEIGVLIALGWRRWRILRMILWESLTLCVAAGFFGILSGIAILKLLAMSPWMQGRLEPHISLELLGLAMGLSIAVGIVSGIYPALHCTRINPSLAIRQA